MSAEIQSTHEWRLGELEKRMERVELRIQAAVYLLIANLISVLGSGIGLFVAFMLSRSK